ncbi:ParB N-terminal domain-containing protein [Aggregatibacter actinomycetemcomitans]|uniref:ParB N-terminal domain-containing protein n=1 Tax=Aggregatibacter actinomycetemcomitans TaxID=714 RepID=UPI001E3B37C4|nr:ParB N-terminal domain-containing protein [Aggregatibacter actinomycetemcomitans]
MANISIRTLYLDPKNPRHIPIENQKAIINYLIENEKVKELAKDIAEKGMTNPLDLVGIVTENNKKLVVEGNRRVCALKLLDKPSLAPKKYQKYFTTLQGKAKNHITKIPAHVFPNRDEASVWLSTLHTASSTTSRKPWSPEQKTRFDQSADGKPSHAAALTILDFSLANELISPEKSQKVITTITRMLSTPEVREAFGITTGVTERNILINITKEEFTAIITQYFNDFDNPYYNIGSRSNKNNRLDYIKYLQNIGKIPSKRLDKEIELIPGISSTATTSRTISQKSTTQKKITRVAKSKSAQLIDYELEIPVSKIQSIYSEINTMDIEKHPYATAALLRALIEQSCDYFLLKSGNSIQFHEGSNTQKINENSKLREKILGIAQYFKTNQYLEDKELSALTNECATKKDGSGTLNLLHGVLHNYAHNICSAQIISAHNNLRPFIIAIWSKFCWPNNS